MGMLFNSQAVYFLSARLNAEFSQNPVAPAMGFAYWSGNAAHAVAFRAALLASKAGGPAIGLITLEYFGQFNIPDSHDGEIPAGADPSAGRSYMRWVIFWRRLRHNYSGVYNNVVDLVYNPLNAPGGVQALMFTANQGNNPAAVSSNPTANVNLITLTTPFWHAV
jgi:hypothetical protein